MAARIFHASDWAMHGSLLKLDAADGALTISPQRPDSLATSPAGPLRQGKREGDRSRSQCDSKLRELEVAKFVGGIKARHG